MENIKRNNQGFKHAEKNLSTKNSQADAGAWLPFTNVNPDGSPGHSTAALERSPEIICSDEQSRQTHQLE
jgi:hypothetical protein